MRQSAGLIIAITRGLVRSQHTRRMTMFVVLLAAMVMLFLGATFLSGLLEEHPFGFICFWAVCAWLTLSAVLLALFDMLAVRAQSVRERQRLRKEIFSNPDEHND